MLRDTRVGVCGFVLLAIRLNRCVARGISPTIFSPLASQQKERENTREEAQGQPKGNPRERQGQPKGNPRATQGKDKGKTGESQRATGKVGKSVLMVKLWRRRTRVGISAVLPCGRPFSHEVASSHQTVERA
jgi:hypothetical protein